MSNHRVSRQTSSLGRLKLVTGPTAEPVTRSEAKEHLNLESSFTDDDTYIDALIEASRQAAEDFMNRPIMKQTWQMDLPWFPTYGFQIPKPPLQSVDSIKYYDDDDTLQTLASSVYDVFTWDDEAEVREAEDQSWPETNDRPDAVQVTFTAGYDSGGSPTAGEVPNKIKQAILMIIADLYENREAASNVQIYNNRTAYLLLWPERVDFV